jgi:hypothetical protein
MKVKLQLKKLLKREERKVNKRKMQVIYQKKKK